MEKKKASSVIKNDDLELELPVLDGCLEDELDDSMDDLEELGIGNLSNNEEVGLDVSTGCDQLDDDFDIFNLSDSDETQSWCADCEASDDLFGADEELLEADENGWLEADETSEQFDWFTDDLFCIPGNTDCSQEDNGEEGIEEFTMIDDHDDEISLPPLDKSEEDSPESEVQDELEEDLLAELNNSEFVRDEGEEE